MAINELDDNLKFAIPEKFLSSPQLQAFLASRRQLIGSQESTIRQIELYLNSAKAGNKEAKGKILDWKIRQKKINTDIVNIERQIESYCKELEQAEKELGL